MSPLPRARVWALATMLTLGFYSGGLPRGRAVLVEAGRGTFGTRCLLSALRFMVACFFKDELCMDLPFVHTESYPGASWDNIKLRRLTLILAPFKGIT